MRIKEIPLKERPRERLIEKGVENISNEDLLAILLKNGTKNNSVKDIALSILKRIDGIENIKNIRLETFRDIKGLGTVKILELISAIELGKRVYLCQKNDNSKKLNDPETIFLSNRYLFNNKKQEYFYCLYLDNKNRLIERKLLFMGTINRSVVHPREIFKEAYLLSSSGLICMHNHPSGDPTPSEEDLELTKALVEIGRIQGIKVLDHLIMTDNEYYSFFKEGKIK